MTIVITAVHGESGSVFHVVDRAAPEAEQPCILSSHKNRDDADTAAGLAPSSASE